MTAPKRRQVAPPNILEAMVHDAMFGRWFADPSYDAWRAWLAAVFALEMTPAQQELYTACTGRHEMPTRQAREAWLFCGRRAGKSKLLSMVAIYLGLFIDWKPQLTVGERGVIMITAADRAQAKVIFDYISGILRAVPAFAAKVRKEKAEEIELMDGLVISINTTNYRTIRGRTCVAFLADEICFWRDAETAASPADEVLAAVRPSQATVPDALLICASSPYLKSGPAWETAKRYHGVEHSPILVWQNAPSRLMNPTLSEDFIAGELERDPVAGRSEYLGEWRDDISGFCTREMVMACTAAGELERPYDPGKRYLGFCDPSGGSSDAMVGSVGFARDGIAVVSAVMEIKAPFNPGEATERLAAFFKGFKVRQIQGDRYGGEWPAQRFLEHGITYRTAELSKSDYYREFLPLLAGRLCSLPDLPRLQSQLCSLERRVTRGSNKEIIDHPSGSQWHDDVGNCVAGLCVALVGAGARRPMVISDKALEQSRINTGYAFAPPRRHPYFG